jgi:ABC-type lipoprotein export system ATPase subunit
MVTHDRKIAENAQKIYHMKDGQIERVEMVWTAFVHRR